MNPTKHSQISARRRGGVIEDYLDIHVFVDHTKALCADGRHRLLHNHWGVQHVVIPIFGHTRVNADGASVDIKDLCEEDHLLMDYRRKFIPTLSDFVAAIDSSAMTLALRQRLDRFHQEFAESHPEASELLLSPLALTGKIESLLITHNSWFINSVMPKVLGTTPRVINFEITPTDLFTSMRFEPWMDNGLAYPPSARGLSGGYRERDSAA